MDKVNIKRVLLGGIVAAVVFIVVELFIEGMVHVLFRINEKDLLLQYYPDITLHGLRYHIVNISYLLGFCLFIIWIYAILISKFGSGYKTAILAGLVFFIPIFLFMINQINMNIFPLKLCLITSGFSIIELFSASIVGASFYTKLARLNE